MPLPLANTAEGQTTGTTVTNLNSGGASGDPFDTVPVGLNMALTFDSANPMHGVNAYKLAQTSTATAITYLEWTNASVGSKALAVRGRFYFRSPAQITSSIRLLSFLNGTTVQGVLGCTNGMQGFQWRGGVAGDTAQGNISGTLSVNTWYRVEFQVWLDVARCACYAQVYTGDSGTLQGQAVSTGAQFGVAPVAFDRIRLGATTANWSLIADAMFFDDLSFELIPNFQSPLGSRRPLPMIQGPDVDTIMRMQT